MNNLSSSIEKISPGQAGIYLRYNYKHQRGISKRVVNYYADEMKKGRFAPASPLYFCLFGKETVLINGQHTLSAIIQSQCTQYMTVIRHIVDSEDEIARLYARIDRGRSRFTRDSFEPFRVQQKLGISKTSAGKIISAVKFAKNGFTGTARDPMSVEDEIAMIEEWQDPFALVYESIINEDKSLRQKVQARAVLSVALITARYQPEKAREFWYQVARDDKLAANDPRKTLRYKLLTTVTMGGGALGSRLIDVRSPRYIARATARAWSAFFNGETLQVLLVRDERAPIVIDGTPYDGVNNPT